MSGKEKFLLKDHLFNVKKVKRVASEISEVYPEFRTKLFIEKAVSKFPELELMERVYWLRDCLIEFLPQDYRVAVNILLESLPLPCDPSLSDDDFGDFIYLPYSFVVVEQGCTKQHLKFSLAALKKMTTRFSVEGPIRFFINEFPKKTVSELYKWTTDKHYHVRRLASEGTRPNLPWAKRVSISSKETLPILNVLYSDKTRFVTRSVANHLNDISKTQPGLVIKALKRWKKEGVQSMKELNYITRHSLRTLVKDGNIEALKLLGYSSGEIKVQNFSIKTPEVKIGNALEFSFDIVSTGKKSQNLMIDYILFFRKSNGDLTPKTHKICKKQIVSNQNIVVEKKHPLRIMTTRKLYPGEHKLELQINGQKFGKKSFILLE